MFVRGCSDRFVVFIFVKEIYLSFRCGPFVPRTWPMTMRRKTGRTYIHQTADNHLLRLKGDTKHPFLLWGRWSSGVETPSPGIQSGNEYLFFFSGGEVEPRGDCQRRRRGREGRRRAETCKSAGREKWIEMFKLWEFRLCHNRLLWPRENSIYFPLKFESVAMNRRRARHLFPARKYRTDRMKRKCRVHRRVWGNRFRIHKRTARVNGWAYIKRLQIWKSRSWITYTFL